MRLRRGLSGAEQGDQPVPVLDRHPELAEVPLPLRFAPWQKPDVLAKLAPGYPRHPIVDLAAGRDGALAAYRKTGD